MAHNFKDYPELTNSQLRFYYFESPHKQITSDFEGHIVKVHDGDTVTIECEFRDFTFPIRMADIAAPELNEVGGLESQSWLEDKLLNQDVRVEIDYNNRVGKWGRLIGRIKQLGMDVGKESLINGYSKPFRSI